MQKSEKLLLPSLDTISKTSYECLDSSFVWHCILFIVTNRGPGTWIHTSLLCGNFIIVVLVMEFVTP